MAQELHWRCYFNDRNGAGMPRHLPRTLAVFRLAALTILLAAQGLGAQSIVGPPRKGEPARVTLRTPLGAKRFWFRKTQTVFSVSGERLK